ncbi:terminase small subunit [Acetobacter sp. P5B1]|uniref:terminase small subunit n=1 Tax=Acetobacter sp. P5B1 TaxID=2762620 RepID=UPI001C04E4B4
MRAGYSEKTASEQGARLLVNVKVASAISVLGSALRTSKNLISKRRSLLKKVEIQNAISEL